MFYEAARIRKMLRRCDMYVVRLLPDPNNNPNHHKLTHHNGASREGTSKGVKGALEAPGTAGSARRDAARFGNSRPCVRCLRVLDAMGVHRVIFSTGEHKAGEEECISCEVHTVRELLRGAGGGAGGAHPGHCSRGDSSQRHLLPHRPNARLVPSLLAC
mmetsp:Transcript_14193/g.35223  ORF Transcript_14193/g.35223 Transcript_14193/m.35223 type:complete len:159 (-) Transcript_14193:81-557(-)